MKLSEIADDKLVQQLDYIGRHMRILDLRDADVTNMEWGSIQRELKDHNAISFPGRTIEYSMGIDGGLLPPAPFDVLECYDLRLSGIIIMDFSPLPKKINGGIYIRECTLHIPHFMEYLEYLPLDTSEIYMTNCKLDVDDVYEMLESKYRFRFNFDVGARGYRVYNDLITKKIRVIELGGTKIVNFDSVFELQEWFIENHITRLD